MARLPRKSDLGGLPSAKTGRPIATYDVTPIGKGVQDLGQGISRLGVDLAEHQSAAQKYDTEARFQEFKWNQREVLDKAKFDTTPDQVDGFSDRWVQGYGESAKQFYETVPENLKDSYHQRLKDTERQYFRDASGFMRGEQRNSAINRLGEKKTSYIQRSQSGAPLDEIRNDYASLVDANPYLSGIEKDKLLRNDFGEMELAHIQSRWKSGGDPDSVMRDLGGVLLDTDENPELRAEPTAAPASNDNQARPVTTFSKPVNAAITQASQDADVDPQILSVFARIESGGRPGAKTGSYKGLFQLSDSEFKKYGGGDIYDAGDNARAAAKKLKAEAAAFEDDYGRAPSVLDLYMIHQQGVGGYDAHMSNPDRAAWENMASTGEGRQKGDGWAKQAIWGNIPNDVKKQFPGGVESVTSADFVGIWRDKVERFGGDATAGPAQPEILSASYDGPYKNIPAEARLKLMQTFQEEYRGKRRAAAIMGGTLPVDPGSKEDRDTINKAFETTPLIDGIANHDRQSADQLAHLAKTISYIPERAFETLRGMALNGTIEDRHYAYQTLGRIMRERPAALSVSGGEGFSRDMADEIETFNTMVADVGLPAEEAIGRIDQMRSPEFQARQGSLKKEADELVKDLAVEDITREYRYWFTSPAAGGSDRQASFMLDAYRDMVSYHYIRTGDPKLAKKVALNEMTKAYKVSTITGNKRLMAHAPETYYDPIETVPGDGPSYEYFQEDLKNTVNKHAGRLGEIEPGTGLRAETGLDEIPLEDIFLEVNRHTSADLEAGQAYPSYKVVYRQYDEDGIPAFVALPRNFYVDVKAALAKQSAIVTQRAREDRAEEIRQRAREGGRPLYEPIMPQFGQGLELPEDQESQ